MAIILYFIYLIILAGGIIHDHVILRKVLINKLLEERLRCVSVGGYSLARSVTLGPSEFCGRLTNSHHQNTVDGLQHLSFTVLQHLFRSALVVRHITQFKAKYTYSTVKLFMFSTWFVPSMRSPSA